MPDSNALLVGYRSCFYPVGLQVITAAVVSLIFIMAFLGRQFDFNLDFLNVTASTGVVKFWQVTFLVGGMALSYLFLQILRR